MGKENKERCHYKNAIEDPNNTTGMGLRNSKDLMCTDCDGSREDAVRLRCLGYLGVKGKGRLVKRNSEGEFIDIGRRRLY
jgi:hypothetical protein